MEALKKRRRWLEDELDKGIDTIELDNEIVEFNRLIKRLKASESYKEHDYRKKCDLNELDIVEVAGRKRRGRRKRGGRRGQKRRGRCWKGYRPTPGKKPYSRGSCQRA